MYLFIYGSGKNIIFYTVKLLVFLNILLKK